MLNVTIQSSDLVNMSSILGGLSKPSLTNIFVHAINETAFQTRKKLIDNMTSVFDRPTRYTLGSLRVVRAKPTRLYAQVGFQDFGGKGNTAGEYLTPQIFGGTRSMKRIEEKLSRTQFAGRPVFLIPGPDVKLDAYGNPSRGVYSQLSAFFSLGRDTGYTSNRSYRSGKRNAGHYFMILPGRDRTHGLPAGIYQRTGKTQKLLFFIQVRPPQYKTRFRFYDLGVEYTKLLLPKFINDSVIYAVRNRGLIPTNLGNISENFLQL